MVQRTETDGAAERGRRGPARAWSLLVDGLAALGTLMICVLMLIICADVVARNLMGASLPLVSELGALVLVMIVYLQLATTVRADRLARTEIFYLGFRRSYPRAGAWLGAIFDARRGRRDRRHRMVDDQHPRRAIWRRASSSA